MDDVSTHQEAPGRLSPLGDTPTDGVAASMEGRRELDLPTIGNVNGGGGIVRCGYVCLPTLEHTCTVQKNIIIMGLCL